ncbi:DUF4180 domain-containing protein [Deinococcus alpinitundrae]|uniref:DUF4180 domain-containing protein n=1 Tax=Deinococcus alpinitundrae TaxID=468913 RepID=UPI00137A2852|nr:DUF4180 domain-containing protein [Deinococcus alpinitundrae]
MTDQPNIKTAGELGLRVDSLADIPDLIGAAFSVDGLMLTEADLGSEFFRLRSGVAGELFQKLVNYRVPTALVLEDFSAYGERFAELASEHSRHPSVRFVTSEVAAREWLNSQAAQ